MRTVLTRLLFPSSILAVSIVSCMQVSLGSVQAACIPAPSGLVGWWPGNSGSDASGKGNDADISGLPFVPGKVGTAFDFGASSGFAVPPSSELAVLSLTFAAWIKPSDSSYAPIIMYQHPNDYHGAHFWTGDRF